MKAVAGIVLTSLLFTTTIILVVELREGHTPSQPVANLSPPLNFSSQ